MKTNISTTLAILFSITIAFSQSDPTNSKLVQADIALKKHKSEKSIVKNIHFKNIGPTIMSGRVVDVDANPNNPNEFYVGYASGGVWYTNNNGTSFTSVFDNAPTQNIGDIAIDWKNGTIWVGTGESNSSRSSYPGIGILKSTDKGKSWKNMGLLDSHHIGRIIINKDNPNVVVVGVLGHLYSPNAQRGVFKTTNGGKTWDKTLFIDENTGVVDISASPTNPNVLYAGSWERERKSWDFDGDGPGSAVYKSTDAGSSWSKMTSEGKGFPTGSGVGRIGIATFNDNVVYAFLDNQFRRPPSKKKKGSGLKKDDFKTMSNDDFLKLDNKSLNRYLRSNRFDKKETASVVKKAVKNGSIKPIHLATYLEDANSKLFDTPVIGAEVYKSVNGGKTWKKTHKNYLDGVYSSYGYYFGIIGVNTTNENKIYIGGVPLLKSDDGGKTFKAIGKANVHSDHQALWVNPSLDGHVINGNDGGVNITYDDGKNWTKNNPHAVGQFYAINVDHKKPYNVYGGLQDNGVWYGPSTYTASKRWEGRGQYPYKAIGGGDGMQVQIDNRDNETVYTGSQFGYYFRINLKTRKRISIHPKHELGSSPYRYNWQTPILLSPHNQDILYMGANKLLRSMDQGETFKVISNDLTTGGKKGNVPYGTLTTISESPLQFGLIYTGSDDGLIHLTKDGGNTWNDITGSLPKNLWVSRVIASKYIKSRVYATLNGMRFDDFTTYVYMSENYGKTWKNISNDFTRSAVNVIKEDEVSKKILYVGTDNGLHVTFNNGKSWHPFVKGLPNVAVHDIVIQPEAKELVVGTHGRSIYKADISVLENFNDFKNKAVHLFAVDNIRHSSRWGASWSQWSQKFLPETTVSVYANSQQKVTLSIYAGDVVVNTISMNAGKGFNTISYDVSFSKKGRKAYLKATPKAKLRKSQNGIYYLPKGKYTIKVGSEKQSFSIK